MSHAREKGKRKNNDRNNQEGNIATVRDHVTNNPRTIGVECRLFVRYREPTTPNFYLARLAGALAPIVWLLPLKGDTDQVEVDYRRARQAAGARARATAKPGEEVRERNGVVEISIHPNPRRCQRKWVHGPALAIHRDSRLHRVILCNGSSSLPLVSL